jgi:hypothetical protein
LAGDGEHDTAVAASGLGLDVEAEEDEATTRRSRALSSTSLASFVTSSFVAELSGQNRSFSVRCRATSLAAVAGRPPGDGRRIPNGCWSTAQLSTAISKLPAGRSVNYLVDEVDDSSSRPFVADALHRAARTSRLALDRTSLARCAVDCRRWPPGPASRVVWVRAAGHARQGCGELWHGGELVAGGGQRY